LWHLLHTLVWLSAQSPKKRSGFVWCGAAAEITTRVLFFFFFENSVSTDSNLIKKLKLTLMIK
jgi:hypothetical protein